MEYTSLLDVEKIDYQAEYQKKFNTKLNKSLCHPWSCQSQEAQPCQPEGVFDNKGEFDNLGITSIRQMIK